MEELITSANWGTFSLIFFFVFFCGVVLWVMRPGSSEHYDDAGNIPLREDDHV